MKNKKDIDMKQIIHIAVLIILALPMQAQNTFSLRIRIPKDYPHEIEDFSLNTVYVDDRTERQHLLRNGWDFTILTEASKTTHGSIWLLENEHSQNGNSRWSYEICSIPIIPGEKAVVNILDTMHYEISGSRIYREYDKARKTIFLAGENARDYISHHRREKGCYLYLRSIYNTREILDGIHSDSLLKLFDKSVQDYFNADCRKDYKPFHTDEGAYDKKSLMTKRDNKFLTLNRYAEGEALLDTIRERYRGMPTLICINYDNVYNKHELLRHANGLNIVTLLNPISGGGSEQYLLSNIKYSPCDHYIVMVYQLQSLCDLIQSPARETAFILLDAEGKIIGKAGSRKEYRQLLLQLNRVRQEMGLIRPAKPFYKKAPKMRFLDLDPTTDDNTTVVSEARDRMEIMIFNNTNVHRLARQYSIAPLSPKKLKVSKRLYDYVKGKIDENNANEVKRRDAIDDLKRRRELGDKEADEPFDRADFPVGNAVDLGLSVKWADMNVGAKAPEQGGYYYAWGEVSPVPDKPVEWATYKWCEGSSQKLTKYCTKAEFGKVDNLTTLQPCDDVAHVRWGGDWRMPTADELQELCDKCTWEWVVINGKPGSRVTGPNGNSIFLPANGMYNHLGLDTSLQGVKGYIWASEINPDNPVMTTYFVHRNGACEVRRGTTERRPGIAVRPVQGK
ncbi:MAG: hypothetical protein KBT39_04370 [Bacteroidales bacterium]|nr:hypothetical protein [Bacteroidales bacterium]